MANLDRLFRCDDPADRAARLDSNQRRPRQRRPRVGLTARRHDRQHLARAFHLSLRQTRPQLGLEPS